MQNRFTKDAKSLILDATILLLDKKPYEKITVSDITNKAGIARRTFYRNFREKNDILIQYLAKIINLEYPTINNDGANNQQILVLTINIGFIHENYSKIKKILPVAGRNIQFLNSFNNFMATVINCGMEKRNPREQLIYKNKMYYQLTGICKTIWDWVEDNMLSTDDLINLLDCFTVNTQNQYINVPNIKIRTINNR